jgi:ankyrin repeat protein
VRYLIKQGIDVHRQINSTTSKWRILRATARFVVKSKMSRSKFLRRIAESGGLTALHYAARRCDVEIVEILMQYGAKPSVKNDLGRDVFSYCEYYPAIRSAMARVQREKRRLRQCNNDALSRFMTRPMSSHSLPGFTLQRRNTTATPVLYDMYLLNLSSMMSMFGDEEEREKNLNICHQDLLKREQLVRYEDLPLGAFVMFVSHQWNGFNHPDPSGVQIECMVRMFRRLRDGKIDRVDMDPFHTILYRDNRVTRKSEWIELLSNAYIFYDFWSQPQPFREPNLILQATLKRELSLAIASMGAYVERADCLVVLAPSSYHVDRIDTQSRRHEFTCYRTYRKRAFCVMEMMCTYLSRRKTHPMLLIRSPRGVPNWISPIETIKLVVGESNFMCCERNHEDMFETCDRVVARDVLIRMIHKKTEYLFGLGNVIAARLTLARTLIILRGLPPDVVRTVNNDDDDETMKIEDRVTVTGLRNMLMWDDLNNDKKKLKIRSRKMDGPWFDRGEISILLYAITLNQTRTCSSLCLSVSLFLYQSLQHIHSKIGIVEKLLLDLDNDLTVSQKERHRRLVSAVPSQGFAQSGITGNMNALSVAMFAGTPTIVEMLLKRGFDPKLTDIAGNNPLHLACASNRVANVMYWLNRFPNWNLEASNNITGGVALGVAVYMGPNRLELTKLLLKAGARIDSLTHTGTSILTSICSNEDADPDVLRFILNHYTQNINFRMQATNSKWKIIHIIAKIAVRVFNTSNGLFQSLAKDSGSTALHYAARRGDIDIVEILLSEGADPSVRTYDVSCLHLSSCFFSSFSLCRHNNNNNNNSGTK